jgi:hypothetical protein
MVYTTAITTGATRGEGTVNPFGTTEFTPVLSCVRVDRSFFLRKVLMRAMNILAPRKKIGADILVPTP